MSVSKLFIDEFKAPRNSLRPTRFPIVLCHGLMGFDTITLPTGKRIEYFHGVRAALEKQGAVVSAHSVPPMASIQLRAEALYNSLLASKVHGGVVNIIAHSMGGLDARLLISDLLKAKDIKVASLTTLSTPHRGSPVADLFRHISAALPPKYSAFQELTTHYMKNVFNKSCQNDPNVAYFSYGARIKPSILSPFYIPGKLIQVKEGDNDGMVSVESAKWGTYMGTIDKIDHGDIINLTRYKPRKLLNHNYSSIAMYLDIMDTLAGQGF